MRSFMNANCDRFNRFIDILRLRQPDIKIKFKDESWFMKLLGKLAFFNKNFMTTFTTVIGKTIYLPTRAGLENSEDLGPLVIVAHEYRHMVDFGSWIKSFFVRTSYFAPQIFSPLMLLLLLLPVIWAISVPLSLLLFFAWLTPIPSPGRKYFEFKGYTTSLFAMNEIYKENKWSETERKFLLEEQVEFMNEQFTSSAYYYMWPWGVKEDLRVVIDKVISESLAKEDSFYAEMKDMIGGSK
jgi:hypothetical protein